MENKNLEKIINKNKLAGEIHSKIISADKNIMFRVFPLYIRYSKNDKVVVVLFLKGKFVDKGKLVLGLNLDKKPEFKGFKDAKYMSDSNLTYSYSFKESSDLSIINKIIKTIKA